MNSSKTLVALVTGSTSGIGLGIAETFLSHKMNVFMHGLEPQAEELCLSMGDRFGVEVPHSRCDLSTEQGCNALTQDVNSRYGGIDVLVNNAGIQYVSHIQDFPTEKWNEIISVNLSAPFFLSRAVWSGMKAQGFGRIINIASVHGLRASSFKSAYVASKHGLVGLTKTLALEGAPFGITVNAICPGYVRTPLIEKQIQDQAKTHNINQEDVISEVILQKQPIKEFIPVATIAELAYFLCSPNAGTVTGTAFPLDGGWSAQ